MLRRPKRFTFGVLLLLTASVMAAIACVFIGSIRAKGKPQPSITSAVQTKTGQKVRSLSLQPEARKLSRLLGSRFLSSSRSIVTITGTVTIGPNSQTMTIARRQTETGESVQIASGTKTLSWNEVDAGRATTGIATPDDEVLLERLVFDGPEQFVLAQVRGASYYTIARNVRPENTGSDYSGPLWTIVRVTESQPDDKLPPMSAWRLYYINTGTGLIDRVVSQSEGQTVEATILSWNEQNGERIPGHITWSVAGKLIMDYRVTNFSYSE